MATTIAPHHDDRAARAVSASSAICLPLIVLFAVLVHVTVRALTDVEFYGDEVRYYLQASALANGGSMYPEGLIRNPPLFPAMLAFLLRVGVPPDYLACLSIAFMAIASGLVFSMSCRFLAWPWALLVAVLFTLYPPNILLGSRIMTEPLASMLLLLLCRSMLDVRPQNIPGLLKGAGIVILLAMLALTKPVFAYAYVVAIVILIVFAVFATAHVRQYRLRLAMILAFSLIACTPYLAFTHKQTGGYFSWLTSDAEHFYWMSVGGEDIWGNWVPVSRARQQGALVASGVVAELDTFEALPREESALYLRERTLERIRANPEIYVRNVFANVARVLFNYPFSFRSQSLMTYGYILPNMTVYLAILVGMLLLPMTIKYQKPGLVAVVALSTIYLCGNFPVSSAARQGVILLGPFLLWIACQWRIALTLGLVGLPPRARE